jgi:mono/diheme cytochrome c family protein
MKNLFSILLTLCFIFLTLNSFAQASKDEWTIPDKYQKMSNPVKADAASLAEGKTIWAKHCQSCHGKTGLGDGSKAAQLKTEPGDFSKESFQKQTDGVIFYKALEGREDMPSFKKKIPDQNELWSVVNYIRTFAKKK